MFWHFDSNLLQEHRSSWKKIKTACSLCCILFGFIFCMTILAMLAFDMTQKVHIVYIKGPQPLFITDEKFLSVALDSSLIAEDFRNFHFNDKKLHKLLLALSPAYLRIGGTMADRLTFSKSTNYKYPSGKIDGGVCAYEETPCDYLDRPNFTMNAEEWLKLNRLADNTGLEIIFDLNALKRFENGSWNYANAEKLIKFSNLHQMKLNWELGNEPNAFLHQFNYEVPPAQMAQDFQMLRQILDSYPLYKNSLLLGPDVTRPVNEKGSSTDYLQDFISNGGDVVDAVTWHQYYFNGATAKVGDFLNLKTFKILQWQIDVIKTIVKPHETNKSIWLGETSSAYGGGAPNLSDRFVASFLWLDKLGLAAKNGLSVVIRQSVFQGHYALINNNYTPTPDWWVSILYKRLVSNKVVDCNLTEEHKVRLYCHCAKKLGIYADEPAVVVFGLNLNYHKAKIRFEGISSLFKDLRVEAYILTTFERIDSRFIYLNGDLLELTENNDVPVLLPKIVNANPFVEMPAFSMAFWVVPITENLLFC